MRISVLEKFRGRAAAAMALSLGSGILSRIGLLVLAMFMGRTAGPKGYGIFNFVTGAAIFGSQLAALGWPENMNRLVPTFAAKGEWNKLRGAYDAGNRVVLVGGIAGSAVLIVLAYFIPNTASSFYLSALLLPLMAFVVLRRQQLGAVGWPAIGLLFDQGFGAVVVSIAIIAYGPLSVPTAIYLYAMAIICGLFITTWSLRRLFPAEIWQAVSERHYKEWMLMALPIMIGSASRQLLFRTDVLLVAPLSTLTQVGLYGAAFRLTYLLTFPQAIMIMVIMPKFSHAFAAGNFQRVKRLLRIAYSLTIATSLPFVIVFIAAPGFVMTTVFGEPFRSAAPCLVLLAMGQFAASMAIPSMALLTMGGREREFAVWNVACFCCNAIVCIYVVPRFGAIGAAASTAIASAMQFGGQIKLAANLLGRSPTGAKPQLL